MYLQLCLRSGSRHSARTSRRCQRQNLLPYDRENCCAAGQPSTLLPTASEAPGSKMGTLFYWLGRTPSHPRLSVRQVHTCSRTESVQILRQRRRSSNTNASSRLKYLS